MKWLVILLLFLSFFAFFFLTPNSSKANVIDYKEKEEETLRIFLFKEEKLEGIKLRTKASNKHDKVHETINYMTSKINSTPKGYYSQIPYSSKLLSFSDDKETLYLNFDEEFLRVKDFNGALEQLSLSFNEIGYSTLFLLVDGKPLETFMGLNLANGVSNFKTNIQMRNCTLRTKDVTIKYYLNDVVYPVSYIIDSDTDILSFSIKEIETFYGLDLDYEKNDQEVLLDIDNFEVETTIKESLSTFYSFIFS